jgi:branched-chain amino acid transport system permease protein
VISSYAAGLLADIGIAGIGALSVHVILAAGQLSLGNAAFMAAGAYLASLLTVQQGLAPAAAIALGGLGSAALGLLVGFPALRLRGIYLAMATLGFGEMTRSFFLGFEPTGGAAGFAGMARISLGFIWAWTLPLLALVLLLERSRLWLALHAVSEDETAARLLGLDAVALKLGACTGGAALAGIAGGLFAHWHVFIEPGNFGLDRSTEMVLAVVLGGSTIALGPIFGAAVLVLAPEALRFIADWRMAGFGALLIGILLVRRQGLIDWPLLRALWPGRRRPAA